MKTILRLLLLQTAWISPVVADSVAFTYNSAADVPITASGYTATGNTLDITLNFAPEIGTVLTVVNNVSLNAIGGQFSNLSQGQTLALSFEGLSYKFVANYLGGTGNDLLLRWAENKATAWGDNSSGQLGNKNTTNSRVPIWVTPQDALAGKSVGAVATGGTHSLALTFQGRVVAWGANESGQLGDLSTTDRRTAVSVEGVLDNKTAIAVAAGYQHSLALCSDGTLATWGANDYGQLGDGGFTPTNAAEFVLTNGPLAGKAVQAVALGAHHNLALCTDSTLVSWGRNTNGQLGDGSTVNTPNPINVTSMGVLAGKTVLTIAAGSAHSLALCADGTVAAWGSNDSGQLGDNTFTNRPSPVAVNTAGVLAGKTVLAVAAGGYHSLALCSDGTVVTWGRNSNGQLGNNSLNPSATPVIVSQTGGLAGKTVISLAAGAYHSLALTSDGTLASWGRNSAGELGNNSITNRSTPVAVSKISLAPTDRFVSVSSGALAFHSLAVVASSHAPAIDSISPAAGTTNGGTKVTIYGKNLGATTAVTFGGIAANFTHLDDTTITVTAPAGTSGAASILITSSYGTNPATTFYSYADEFTATFQSETSVPGTSATIDPLGVHVNFTLNFAPQVGTNLTVLKNQGGGIFSSFGNLAQGQPVMLTFAGLPYHFVANYFGGRGNDLVLQWAGTKAMAWGNNDYGQLGDISSTNRFRPTPVTTQGILAGKTIVSASTGTGHSICLCSDGTVATWGRNFEGQLGNNSFASSNKPVGIQTNGVLAGKKVVAVAAGAYHCLAQCSDGTIAAWGANGSGQLGNGMTSNSSVPVAVAAVSGGLLGKTVATISAGDNHNLARCTDGSLFAWGRNTDGQLGIGDFSSRSLPQAVPNTAALAGKSVIGIAAGSGHSLALCSDGTVAAWGLNINGQLGDNSGLLRNPVPVTVDPSGALAGKTVTYLAAGARHSLALCSDGTLTTWGYGGNGQLGAGSYTDATVPGVIINSSVLTGKSIVSMAGGQSFSLARCSDSTLAAWGANNFGQLGVSGGGTSTPTGVDLSSLNTNERIITTSSGPAAQHTLAIVSGPQIPSVVTVSPAIGTTAGGTSVTIKGEYFTAATGVLIGGLAATGVTVINDTTIRATVPAGPVGPVGVVVTNPSGSNVANTLYTYVDTLTAVFASGASIPVTSFGYAASGIPVSFTLNFAPVTGTHLTVVKNTDIGFIGGTFSNLAQGESVALTYGGITYEYVANYFGGSGNDLVLQWARTRAVSWGWNVSGQLGDGGTTPSNEPAEVDAQGVLAGKTVVSLASGQFHSLALCADGTLAGWGSNTNGQLGDGSNTSSTSPVVVNSSGLLAGKTVVAVAAGSTYSLALCSDGTMAAWGNNSTGQLGDGTSINSTVPVPVDTTGVLAGKSVVAIAAGSTHNLALCSDGTLVGWGDNSSGKLGTNTTTDHAVPTAVDATGVLAGKTVVAIAAGGDHSLALCSDGTVTAWGRNAEGQLGNNSQTGSSSPAAVNMTTGVLSSPSLPVIAVAAGDRHSLALRSDGIVAAWGANDVGQLGNGTYSLSNAPISVSRTGVLSGRAVKSLTAGALHSVVLCSDGTLAAWGSGTSGQLGTGSDSSSNVPLAASRSRLATDAPFIAVNSGQSATHNLALIALPPALTISNWRTTWYGSSTNTGNAADSADPYGTGLSNLLVFAFFGPDQDPELAHSSQLPQPSLSAGNLTYSFDTPSRVTGLTYGAEWSTTLQPGSWHPITDTGTGTHHVFTHAAGLQTEVFVRLTVTPTP